MKKSEMTIEMSFRIPKGINEYKGSFSLWVNEIKLLSLIMMV